MGQRRSPARDLESRGAEEQSMQLGNGRVVSLTGAA
jgi:hypothetical protein